MNMRSNALQKHKFTHLDATIYAEFVDTLLINIWRLKTIEPLSQQVLESRYLV
jgi:hypothetical protein